MYRVNAVAAQVQEILREYAHTSFAYLRPAQARSPRCYQQMELP